MIDPRIQLKNRHLAAVLAFLIPGAGHAYQGRWFKAAIFSSFVLGLFFWGMSLGEWQVVYARFSTSDQVPGRSRDKTIGYLSQVAVGIPALPALIQSQRYARSNSDERAGEPHEFPMQTLFEGLVKFDSAAGRWEGPVSGPLRLGIEDGPFGKEIRGVLKVQEPADHRGQELTLAGNVELGPRLAASAALVASREFGPPNSAYSSTRRAFRSRVIEQRGQLDSPVGEIQGSVPRKFWDWYQVPLQEDALQDLNRRLGRRYEIALLFTWIAGLLNVLAIWDAYEGPAYGYGDESESPDGPPAPSTDVPVNAVAVAEKVPAGA